MDVVTIISIVLGAVAALAGGFWLKAKGKLSQAANLVKQAYEVVAKVNEILEDNAITKDEVAELKKEAQDVRDAFKVLIGKSA
jgi:predicted metal-binding transcription factor (methanogenesis marker protein 9)